MDSSLDFRVLEFDTLRPPRPDGEKEALALLKQAAWQVQPIMKRRQWRILLLKELEPENMTRGARRRVLSLSASASFTHSCSRRR